MAARTNLDLARQRLEDATVRAPIAGTVLSQTVSVGQVISSATSSVSGGTTLLTMADLSRIRVRVMVSETDVGNVQAGQPATVTVDAFPNRAFQGMVEKIEPQAVVDQSVTSFPVLVSLQNPGGQLLPGMNGEVTILVAQRNGARGSRWTRCAACASGRSPPHSASIRTPSARSSRACGARAWPWRPPQGTRRALAGARAAETRLAARRGVAAAAVAVAVGVGAATRRDERLSRTVAQEVIRPAAADPAAAVAGASRAEEASGAEGLERVRPAVGPVAFRVARADAVVVRWCSSRPATDSSRA